MLLFLENAELVRPGRDELLRKLEHAVANSITIVVASVLEDKLPSYQDPDKEASQASKGTQSSVGIVANCSATPPLARKAKELPNLEICLCQQQTCGVPLQSVWLFALSQLHASPLAYDGGASLHDGQLLLPEASLCGHSCLDQRATCKAMLVDLLE